MERKGNSGKCKLGKEHEEEGGGKCKLGKEHEEEGDGREVNQEKNMKRRVKVIG
jgi:hypothetical protein